MITRSRARSRTTATRSPYFPKPAPKSRPKASSSLPFPPISASSFGLIQESLAHDPFRLLIATIFLNRTRGRVAIPVLHDVFAMYPTPRDLAAADVPEFTGMIRCLGFQNQRARRCVGVARCWVDRQPVRGRRWRMVHYPEKGDGVGIREGECVGDEDGDGDGEMSDDMERIVAWEVAHIPGLGAYALDSWRIFCRDVLRGLAADFNGGKMSAGGDEETGFEPEWKRVRPRDKELRAFLAWMWLREGWVWNPETGERKRANNRMRRAGRRGGVLVVKEGGTWMVERVLKAA